MGKVAVFAVVLALLLLLFFLLPRSLPPPTPAPPAEVTVADPPVVPEPPAPEVVPEPSPVPSEGPVHAFRFRVTDAATGEPIEGVRIEPSGDWDDESDELIGEPGVTDAAGEAGYTLANSGNSSTWFRAGKPGYLVVRDSADRGQVTEVRLFRGPPVTGRVTLGATGQPVEGAVVRVWTVNEQKEVCRPAVTDRGGEFALDAVPPDERLYIVTEYRGFAPSLLVRSFGVEGGRVELTVGGRGVLEGRVLGPDGGPVADIEVWVVPTNIPLPPRSASGHWLYGGERGALQNFLYPRQKTGGGGGFRFTGVRLGRDQYAVAKLSEHAEAVSEPFRFDEPGTLVRDIRVPEMAKATVTVLNHRGEIIPEVQVDFRSERVWFDSRQAGVPLDDGRALVQGIAPGRWQVRAWVPDADHVDREIELSPGQHAHIEFRPKAGGAIEGDVVNPDGEPVSGAEIRVRSPPYIWANADEKGSFHISGLADEKVDLRIESSHGHAMWGGRPLCPVDIEGVRPGDAPLKVVLPWAGWVTGRVEGDTEGFRITVYSRAVEGGHGADREADGSFRMAAPEPGVPFLLKITAGERPPAYVECPALKAGESHDLGTLTFPKGTRLTGRVVGPEGEPIEGAAVKLVERWLQNSARTDSQGRFRFDGMPQRPIWARVDAKGFPGHLAVIEPGSEPVVHLTRGGLLRAEVVDADGAPLAKGTYLVSWIADHPLGLSIDDLRYYIALRDGGFEIRLQPGRYRVSVDDDEHEQRARIEVSIQAGAETSRRIKLVRK